jgi:integrase
VYGERVGERDVLGDVVGGQNDATVSGEMGRGDRAVTMTSGYRPAIAVADPRTGAGHQAAIVASRDDAVAHTDSLPVGGGDPGWLDLPGRDPGGADAPSDTGDSGVVGGADDHGRADSAGIDIHAILHGALDDAVKWRRIPVNPADQANPPSARSAKAPEMRVWSREQLRRFLELGKRDGGPDGPEPEFTRARHRFHFVWLFLATSGCRRGEALGLRWLDISFEEATAAIRQTVVPLRKADGHGREARIKPWTKTGRARVIELDRQTLAALRTWRAHQAEERLLVGSAYEDNDLVFCRPDGRPYQPEYFSKMYDRTLARLP